MESKRSLCNRLFRPPEASILRVVSGIAFGVSLGRFGHRFGSFRAHFWSLLGAGNDTREPYRTTFGLQPVPASILGPFDPRNLLPRRGLRFHQITGLTFGHHFGFQNGAKNVSMQPPYPTSGSLRSAGRLRHRFRRLLWSLLASFWELPGSL